MTRSRRARLVLSALVLLVTLSPPVRGEDPKRLLAELAPVLEKAAAAPEPVSAVLAALAAFRDFSLGGPELRELAARAGVEKTPVLAELLANAQRLSKQGDRVKLENVEERSAPIVVEGETKGWLHLDREASLRLKAAKIDDVDGIELSEKKDSMRASLKRIELEHEDGKPVMKVVAGWGPFSSSRTIDLSRVRPRAPAPPTTGIVPLIEGDGLPPPRDAKDR